MGGADRFFVFVLLVLGRLKIVLILSVVKLDVYAAYIIVDVERSKTIGRGAVDVARWVPP